MENSIHHSDIIYKCLRALNLCQVFSHTTIRHVMTILISTFSLGDNGKAVNFSSHSPCHRTTLAHFLNQGKWNSPRLENLIKASVIQAIYGEALRSGKPVFCIVDDTIASKTKPSSRAFVPHRGCVFPPISLEAQTGLWASGSHGHAFLQWAHPELCRGSV